ncbi:MAG TPA: zinc-ribbon domain-containing protein, partial [Burkholderiaceae bacterium]|nr:zinc-ribbon domain-containing protein [Burkholderiaceae bacterium]
MDLNTRCPYCETVFPASLEQLQLRKGFIRCVQCAHIFDGYEHVVASDALPTRSSEPSIRVDRAAGATRPVLQQVPREPRVSLQREPRVAVSREPRIPVPAEPGIPAEPMIRTGPSIQAEPHLSELPSVVRGRREF